MNVQITADYPAGQDVLVLGATSGIGNVFSSFDPVTGTLLFDSPDGSATVAQWRSALRSITYGNRSDAPSTATRTVSFTASDGVIARQPCQPERDRDRDQRRAGRGSERSGRRQQRDVQLHHPLAGGRDRARRDLADPNSPDFTGGRLVVSQSANASANATLSILNQGSGPGQIGIAGNIVSYEGVAIGSYSGGDGLNPLVVGLNGSATPEVARR